LRTFYKVTDMSERTNVSHLVGPFVDEPDVESSLDIQYITAMGLDATNWYWTSPGWLYDFALNFYNTEAVPDVISLSWGWAESQQCEITTQECSTLGVDSEMYVKRTNVEFMKIGLRGTSIIVASGDSGANSRTDETCIAPKLNPDFPAASPYVTTVGATEINPLSQTLKNTCTACSEAEGLYGIGCVAGGTQDAVSYEVSQFASGGGFSNFAKMPAYQEHVVKGYLASGTPLPPASYFNATGRGYPDVSAMGNNYLIQLQGDVSPVGGTSCAAPAFAGIVTLLNTHRLSNGGKTLGFLNPLLYQMHAEQADTFTDVVKGDNKCTESGCFSSCKGYEATKGWDPVTGLGTPKFAAMLAYIEKMDAKRSSSSEAAVSEGSRSEGSEDPLQPEQETQPWTLQLFAAMAAGVILGSLVTHLAYRRTERRRLAIIAVQEGDYMKQPLTSCA